MASFRDFLAELGEAAAHTQDAGVRRSRKLLYDRLFEEKDGRIVPRTVTVHVGDTEIPVPLFVLEVGRPVRMESFEIETETDLRIEDIPDPADTEGLSSIQVGLKRGLFRRCSHAKIRATFSTEEPTEATEVLRDKMNQALRNHFMGATTPTEADDG